MNLPPQTLPSTTLPPTLLLPSADLFARRAARLRHLAQGHSMAEWLNWLADLAETQQSTFDNLAESSAHEPLPLMEGKPALTPDLAVLQHQWKKAHALLSKTFAQAAPAAALPHKAAACLALATGQGQLDQRDAGDLIVAAAMQVAWTAAARSLPLARTDNTFGDSETCPCCGSLPVGAIVMAGEGSAGLRYLECSLCATRWNAVRARCTLCDDGSVVNYLRLESNNGAIQAETCDACHGYIKTSFQTKDILVDPVADDLATLALDVLVGEQGYARGCPNLFLGEGDRID